MSLGDFRLLGVVVTLGALLFAGCYVLGAIARLLSAIFRFIFPSKD